MIPYREEKRLLKLSLHAQTNMSRVTSRLLAGGGRPDEMVLACEETITAAQEVKNSLIKIGNKHGATAELVRAPRPNKG